MSDNNIEHRGPSLVKPVLALAALAGIFMAGRWSKSRKVERPAVGGKPHGKRPHKPGADAPTGRTIAPPPAGSPTAQAEARAAKAQEKTPAISAGVTG